MKFLKGFLCALPLLLVLSCASSLEYSMEAIKDGDSEEAGEYLLEYCDKFSTSQLIHPDPRSGITFFEVLERLGSKDVLKEVYRRKFSSPGVRFLSGGEFSVKLLKIAQSWQYTELINEIIPRIESEVAVYKPRQISKNYLFLVEQASLYLSINDQSFDNLKNFWLNRNIAVDVVDFSNFKHRAVKKNATSLNAVLVEAVTEHVRKNRDSIIKISERKEFNLILEVEPEAIDKEPFKKLAAATKSRIDNSHIVENASEDNLKNLKPRLLKSSDGLSQLRQKRSDMEAGGRYTYEESVECGRCIGSSLVECHTCRGAGHCRHCDHGYVECGSCRGHGFHGCGHCHGDGFILVCERVWDPHCRRYIERTVRVRCGHCHGHGRIACGCNRGLVSCGHCRGAYTCHTCRGSRQVTCPSCRNGLIIKIRKTAEGLEIDRDIEGAERVFHALNSRISSLESLIRRERKLRVELQNYLSRSLFEND